MTDPIMSELMAVTRRTWIPRLVVEVTRAGVLLQRRRLSWRERLLSWPWRPWVSHRTELQARWTDYITTFRRYP